MGRQISSSNLGSPNPIQSNPIHNCLKKFITVQESWPYITQCSKKFHRCLNSVTCDKFCYFVDRKLHTICNRHASHVSHHIRGSIYMCMYLQASCNRVLQNVKLVFKLQNRTYPAALLLQTPNFYKNHYLLQNIILKFINSTVWQTIKCGIELIVETQLYICSNWAREWRIIIH